MRVGNRAVDHILSAVTAQAVRNRISRDRRRPRRASCGRLAPRAEIATHEHCSRCGLRLSAMKEAREALAHYQYPMYPSRQFPAPLGQPQPLRCP